VVLADASLRASLKAQYPDCFARCRKRRSFMIDVLGIDLAEEVLHFQHPHRGPIFPAAESDLRGSLSRLPAHQ